MIGRLLSVGGFTALSRLTGFVRDILMAWTLGRGWLSDAFIVAFLFPSYFRSIFGEGTINPAFLPRYAALNAKGEQESAARFANQVFSWQIAAQLVILAVALLAMPLIVRAITPGFQDNPEQFAATVDLTRITFPYLLLTVVAVQLSAMLNAMEKFWAAAAWSNFLNLAMIASFLVSHWFESPAYVTAWSVVLGGVLQLVFILWAGNRESLRLRIVWPRWTPEMKEFFKAFGAVTFGAASVLIAPLIDTVLASLLPEGSRTALYYADRINQLPLGVLGIAMGTVLLPEMSALLAKGNRAGSDAAQNRSAALILLLTLPFAAVFIAIPSTIMQGIFAHGAFDDEAARLSAVALAAYGAGLPAMALVRIVASTFYARHDTMTPVRATVIALVSNIALKVLFVWGFDLGLAGIALGTSLGAWINVAILTWMGRSRMLLAIETAFMRALPPVLLSAIAAGAGALAGERLGMMFSGGRFADLLSLIAAILGAGVGYLVTVLLFRRALPLGRLAGKK